jgi:hypothetical protein
VATSQPTAVLTATSQRLCGPAPVPPPRRPPVLDRRQVAVPWPGVELRRALGNRPPTSN